MSQGLGPAGLAVSSGAAGGGSSGAALGSAVTIQSISKATEGEAGATAHGFSNGDVVILSDVGMPEADGYRFIERVRAAIAQLPTGQRRALFLAAYLGRTAQEIGELEGIPLGTAKTRITAAPARRTAARRTAAPGAPWLPGR